MKKIILAISGIFCLQLAFIAYNLDDPAAEQSFVRRDADAAELLAESAIDSPFEDEIEAADFDNFAASNEIHSEPTESPAAVSSARVDRDVTRPIRKPVRDAFVENAMTIRPVKIEYKTYNAVTFRPRPAVNATRIEVPQFANPTDERREFPASARMVTRKKKNFFAKSLTVIKKPYDWLKAVGSAIR